MDVACFAVGMVDVYFGAAGNGNKSDPNEKQNKPYNFMKVV